MSITTLALIILLPVLVWRIYTRLKSQMTRQRSIMSRHYTGLLVFGAMVLVPVASLGGQPTALLALLGGAVMGGFLGIYGLRRTRFEDSAEGYYFTPDPRLGVLIAMVLVARVLYLGIEIYLNQGSNQPNPRFTDSPLTMYCLGLSGAYFALYSGGLVRWRRKKRQEIGSM